MVYAILILSNSFLALFAGKKNSITQFLPGWFMDSRSTPFYSVNRRRLQAIVAHFVFSSFNLLLAAPPILLGKHFHLFIFPDALILQV